MQQTNLKETRTQRKTFVGIVTSNKMQKTITVRVASKTSHPLLKKGFIRHKKYHVHDENQIANIGDKVSFVETRPLSATKRWRLMEVIQKVK